MTGAEGVAPLLARRSFPLQIGVNGGARSLSALTKLAIALGRRTFAGPRSIGRQMLFRVVGDEVGEGVARAGEILAIMFAVHATDRGRLLVSVRPDIVVAGRTLTHSSVLDVSNHAWAKVWFVCPSSLLLNVERASNAPLSKLCPRRCGREGAAIFTFAAKHCGLVVLPVTLSPHKPAILCPEEEPEGSEDHGDGEQGEEGEESSIIEGSWWKPTFGGIDNGNGLCHGPFDERERVEGISRSRTGHVRDGI